MRTELQRLQEDLDVTTVYVTHDQTEAMTMGDRIAILDDGELQQVGTPLECYHEPSNLFVAGFIGEPSMTTFEARTDGDRLVAERFEYALSERHDDAIDGDNVVFGIRPEDVEVGSDPDDSHTYEVVVDVVEPKGDENYVHMTFDADRDNPETFTATIGGLRRVEEGDTVVVRFPPEAVHLFDGDTGEAVLNRSLDTVEDVEPLL